MSGREGGKKKPQNSCRRAAEAAKASTSGKLLTSRAQIWKTLMLVSITFLFAGHTMYGMHDIRDTGGQ